MGEKVLAAIMLVLIILFSALVYEINSYAGINERDRTGMILLGMVIVWAIFLAFAIPLALKQRLKKSKEKRPTGYIGKLLGRWA